MKTIDAVNGLRQRIRQHKKQYRNHDDNSFSLFHPAKGFVDAISIEELELALTEFEKELRAELVEKEEKPSLFRRCFPSMLY